MAGEVKESKESKSGFTWQIVTGGAPGGRFVLRRPSDSQGEPALKVKDVYQFGIGLGQRFDVRSWLRLLGYGEGTFTRAFASGSTQGQWTADFKGKLCGQITWGNLTPFKEANVGFLEPSACVYAGTGGGTLSRHHYFGLIGASGGATILRAGLFNFDVQFNQQIDTSGTSISSILTYLRFVY